MLVGSFGRNYHWMRPYKDGSHLVVIPEPLHKIPLDGMVIGWRTYFFTAQPTTFQIWRQVDDTQYMLIGQATYSPSKRLEVHFDLPHSDRFLVRAGDVIGVQFHSVSTVAYSRKSSGCTRARRTRWFFRKGTITIGDKKNVANAFECREYSITVIIAGK